MRKTADKLLAEWFWTDRWMGSSGFLLPIEPRGLYREMLTQAWRRGARLPNDHEAIRRAVGCTLEEWARCWPSIEPFWRVDGTDLVNDTQLEVYAETRRRYERESSRGRAGARAKWDAQASAQAVPKHMPVQCPPSPSPSPSPSQDQKIKSIDGAKGWVYPGLVSSRMEPHIKQAAKDAVGHYADTLDLLKVYAKAAADYEAHGAPEDRLADLKKRARIAAIQLRDRLTDPVPGIEATKALFAKYDAEAATPEQRKADVAKVRAMMAGSR